MGTCDLWLVEETTQFRLSDKYDRNGIFIITIFFRMIRVSKYARYIRFDI